jgi:hypothetical protein
MFRRVTTIIGLLLVAAVPAAANENPGFAEPTYRGPLTAAEKAFVACAQAAIRPAYPTVADAEKAGFVRYTSADQSGAISYANQQWQSADCKHPSQLWYDKHGALLGADFSQLKTGTTPPNLWGVNPGRWWEFDRHVHYVTKDPATGKIKYDSYVADDDFLAAGGSLTSPNAQTLVVMKKVKDASDVVTIFSFPAVWDLPVWIKDNPDGAFAFMNPLVKP